MFLSPKDYQRCLVGDVVAGEVVPADLVSDAIEKKLSD
jgi:hypothetical protein